jgi:hypothetical protein
MGITQFEKFSCMYSIVNILVTKWTQLYSPSLQSMFVTEWVVTLQVSIPFCEMHLCRKLCCIISYHTSGTPSCLTHQPPSFMPSNATLPGHYPTLTIIEPKGLRSHNLFPLRSTYNDKNITLFPITTSHRETPWENILPCEREIVYLLQKGGFVYKVYVWEGKDRIL